MPYLTLQGIETRYHGPTNSRGARISATTGSGIKITRGYDHRLSGEAVHRVVAEELAKSLDWTADGAELIACTVASNSVGYVFAVVRSTRD